MILHLCLAGDFRGLSFLLPSQSLDLSVAGKRFTTSRICVDNFFTAGIRKIWVGNIKEDNMFLIDGRCIAKDYAPGRSALNADCFLVFILIFLTVSLMASCKSRDPSSPISFREIKSAEEIILDKPQFMKASDGIDLAYYAIIPKSKPAAALIFIHGGGAYSGAGYQKMAYGLSEKYDTAVYLIDLRGHGNSGGPRGDAPTVEQLWNDLALMITTVRKNNPGIPLYLGGHSSGGGLILNYLTWNGKADVDGYFFISPQFGYKSATARAGSKISFAKARIWVFVLSALSGGRLLGNTTAVYFNYPEAVLASKPLMLKSITRNMSVSITPDHPQEQFEKIDKRFGLFIGANDDLFVPEKVIQYARYATGTLQAKSVNKIIEKENHLSILLIADDLIGKTILGWHKK
jgi:acylglycerol lipase